MKVSIIPKGVKKNANREQSARIPAKSDVRGDDSNHVRAHTDFQAGNAGRQLA